MKDQFRSRRVALWLNLVPDLVRSGQLETSAGGDLDTEEEYLTYTETLPFIPSIKDISLSKTKMQVKNIRAPVKNALKKIKIKLGHCPWSFLDLP